MRKTVIIALGALFCATPNLAAPVETVRVAVPDRGAWDTSFTELGLQQGFFQEQNIEVEIIHVADQVSLEKALISGDADIAVAAAFPDILAAWVKGASVRIISPEATGAPDIFWFAYIAGPVSSMQDLHGQSVGFSAPGSLSHFVLLILLKDAGVDDARLVPIGPAASGIPMVIMSAQLAASWGAPVAVSKYFLNGKIRLIGRGNDSLEVQNETLRINAANAVFLASHRSTVLGFLKAYKKSVDWAYSTPAAVEAYAKLSNQSVEMAQYIVREFASPATNQLDKIKGEDRVLAQALSAKLIPNALTHDEIKGLYDLVLKDGS